jgi:tetratricopeptide (TPR) repeat protein
MRIRTALAITALLCAAGLHAQSITSPPNGDNEHATVSQNIGLVKITVDYNSPKIHNPYTKEDRRGKIWGTLVPYGPQKSLGYGNCTECPWRGGANENTTFTTTHDIQVQGQTLKAGTYGLHFIPQADTWTVVFSNDAKNWGSFFYDPSHDALRVTAKPEKSEYHEWLTYEFPERNTDQATLALRWEDLQLPIKINVPNIKEYYLAQMRDELKNAAGFDYRNYDAAAQYALTNKLAPKDALAWAQIAATNGFPGQENFDTLSTLADAQEANSMTADAAKTREKAIAMANTMQLHLYARQLLTQGKKQEALAAWELNAKRHPNEWPVNVGLARGYSAAGRYNEALKYAKLAAAQAPDDANKKNLQAGITKLEQGKDMNQ